MIADVIQLGFMTKLLRPKNIVLSILTLTCVATAQIVFFCHAFSARTVVSEYLGRETCLESQLNQELNFYPNGDSRWTLQIPDFDHEFRMHVVEFDWNENRHIPPDSATSPSDSWVGTCTVEPKSPWSYVDVFGVLGPFECKVYGDWRVESSF